MKHSGTVKIETERLVLRKFSRNDCEDMFKNWASDLQIQLEYGEPVYDSFEKTSELLDKYIAGYQSDDYYRWAVIDKLTGENIGQIAFCRVYSDCMTAEIEYCIGKRFWGKGFAGEALSAVIDHAFKNTGFLRLEAYHRAENEKSGRVLQKSSMHLTDTVQRFVLAGETPGNEICYCINRDEFID